MEERENLCSNNLVALFGNDYHHFSTYISGDIYIYTHTDGNKCRGENVGKGQDRGNGKVREGGEVLAIVPRIIRIGNRIE